MARGFSYDRNSPAEQHSAGKWLNEFAEENVAPEVSLELLQVSHPTEVQFFSANMLLTTIKRRWSRFEATLKQKVQHKLTCVFLEALLLRVHTCAKRVVSLFDQLPVPLHCIM